MPTRDPRLVQGLDIAWIIELWRALHGGDPTPEVVAAEVIAALTPYLDSLSGSCFCQPLDRQSC